MQSKLIEFTNKANETADTIATYVKDTLEKRMLLKKCVAFTGDNCNTMFGGLRRNDQGNNVFAKLTLSYPSLFFWIEVLRRVSSIHTSGFFLIARKQSKTVS